MGDILQKEGTQIRFFSSGTFLPADDATNWTSSRGTPTDVLITFASIADGAGRQSDKFRFGVTRSGEYDVLVTVDYTGETPVTGATVDLYLAPSTNSADAEGNVAGNSGLDGVIADGAVPSGITYTEFIKQCQFIGSLVLSDDATVQCGYAGRFSPTSDYAQLIVVNEGGDAFEADNVEAHVVFNPITDESV